MRVSPRIEAAFARLGYGPVAVCVAGPVVPRGSTLSANGVDVVKCAAVEACPGGEAAYSESCSTGYGGLRCGACSDGHYWVGRKCKECYPSKFAVGLLAVVVPFIFALGVASKAPGVFGGEPHDVRSQGALLVPHSDSSCSFFRALWGFIVGS